MDGQDYANVKFGRQHSNKISLLTCIINRVDISYNRFLRDKYHVHHMKIQDFPYDLFLPVDDIEALCQLDSSGSHVSFS